MDSSVTHGEWALLLVFLPQVMRVIDEKPGRPLPPTPTRAEPGSPEKIMVMRERDNQGYHIHHPLDKR